MRSPHVLLLTVLATAALAGCGSDGPNLRFAEQRVRAEYGLRLGEKLDGGAVNVRSVDCTASGERAAVCVADVASPVVNGSVTIRVTFGDNDLLLWTAEDGAPGGDTESVMVSEGRAREKRERARDDEQ